MMNLRLGGINASGIDREQLRIEAHKFRPILGIPEDSWIWNLDDKKLRRLVSVECENADCNCLVEVKKPSQSQWRLRVERG